MSESNSTKLNLSILSEVLTILRFAPDHPIPAWALNSSKFLSITRTAEELSVACAVSLVPRGQKVEKRWRAIKVAGPLDFSLTGILESLARPLAKAKISIFAVSTFDTDYLLVEESSLESACKTLEGAGHAIARF